MTIKTAADMIAEAKSRIREVTVAEVAKTVGTPGAPILLDIRERHETNLGRVVGAVLIPRGSLEQKIEAVAPRDAMIVIYCASGNRSALAADTLRQMGYSNAVNLIGGWNAWVGAGGPTED